MAGMLPGVECARRRRFHQSGGGGGGWPDSSPTASSSSSSGGSSTRRSSFCLYTSNNNESHFSTISSSMQQRSPQSQAYCDEKLGVAARQAKERLDGRLRAQFKTEPPKRSTYIGQQHEQATNLRYNNEVMMRESPEPEVSGTTKKKGSKRLISWGKLSWKSSEQEECAVCLEQLKVEESLMKLGCGHSFHSKCLGPWIQNNSHCPCCRMEF